MEHAYFHRYGAAVWYAWYGADGMVHTVCYTWYGAYDILQAENQLAAIILIMNDNRITFTHHIKQCTCT